MLVEENFTLFYSALGRSKASTDDGTILILFHLMKKSKLVSNKCYYPFLVSKYTECSSYS